MFEQLKQIQKLQQIQNALKNEKIEHEKNGVVVTINGKLEVEDVRLNPQLSIGDQEKAVKDCINEAMRKMQMVVAQKMQSMGGFGM
jgi:DNA-binding protein YbaB